jgi:hypothetical protein
MLINPFMLIDASTRRPVLVWDGDMNLDYVKRLLIPEEGEIEDNDIWVGFE